jgi:hypothetical protein
MSFKKQYEEGKAGESAIAKWLMRRGCSVLPVYEKIIKEGKGPQVFQLNRSLIAPDMLVFGVNGLTWIEAKHKTAFTWWRKGRVFETGIDRRHWWDYLAVRKSIKLPIWLLFLHRGGEAKDSPPSPSGLYGNEILILRDKISHEDKRWGHDGMVYWTRLEDGGALKYLAQYKEVIQDI